MGQRQPVGVIDLLVAGGGPVGLGTAVLAAQHGLRVVVAEPRARPVDKACGEGLMPSAVAAVHALGAEPAGRPFHGIRYVNGEHRAEARFRAGPGLGVRRTILHAALADRADALGVEVIPARLVGLGQDAREVGADLVRGGPGPTDRGRALRVRARYLAAADGLHSPVRHALGLGLPAAGKPRYGLRRHFAVRPWTDLVEVHWSPDAEAYVTPVGDELVGVAVLFRGQGGFESWLPGFPELCERLRDRPPIGPVRGAGPLRQRASRRIAGRVALVGDAAGYVDALTGEGINVGLRAAAELVRCLAADRPGDYERAWRSVSRPYRMLTVALLRASALPPARAALVPAAARVPWAFRAAVNHLA